MADLARKPVTIPRSLGQTGQDFGMGLHMIPHEHSDDPGDQPAHDPGVPAQVDSGEVRFGPSAPRVRRIRRANLRAVPDERGRAWLLDAVALHEEWDDLFFGLVDDDGLVPFRARVSELWENGDTVIQDYLSGLRVHTPDEWNDGFEERHLAEWYRVLVCAHISPVRGYVSPAALKDDLPDLGWVPAEARRLTWGRELAELAATYGSEESAAALELVMRVGNKGWLGQDDIAEYRYRFQTMDRAAFRGAQDLIPLVEDAFEVLTIASSAPERVLLLPGA